MKKSKKPLTINDFTAIIEWEHIEHRMPKRMYKRFCKWMNGQTSSPNGVYIWDLERFLDGKPVID